ncbi:uncharacterized protein LOC119323797 [Triticum dicoccoides]|uniref:uncharacterized protein LOC119323797 n=1 Tax=Triticum dicoccoides TaxID=85692 RepID=UPI001891D4DC|nr:uncharacterized protein LOC119323797 [Triticum dicoccoides]XP_037453407.1 uncharacterized protein LOC119323797 [Triticum dicoccoides]
MLSPMQELNAEGQICEAQGAAATEEGGSPRASEQSMGEMNPIAPGWTKGNNKMSLADAQVQNRALPGHDFWARTQLHVHLYHLNQERQLMFAGKSKRTIMPEEVTDINIPMEPLHYPIFAMVVEQLLPMREVSADRQICATEAAMNTQARI